VKPAALAMWHRATRELFDYWNGLRGDLPAPQRSEIDLAAIRGLLADMFMLDIDAAHRFPFVLSGSRVNALACAEQNGRSFLDLWNFPERRNLGAMLLTVIDAACPLIVTAGVRPEGRQEHEIEILLLPLAYREKGRGHGRGRILGMVAPTPLPSWLGLLPARDFTLHSVQSIDAATQPLDIAAEPVRIDLETAFGPVPFPARTVRASSPVKNVPHLRVFQGGRHMP
jgi:hypothetical protein